MTAESAKFKDTAPIVSIQEAREILGINNVFGPEEWKKFFGDKFQLTDIPKIHWTKTALSNLPIKQDHFLFLGLDSIGGEPLNVATWYKNYSGDKDPKFDGNFGLANIRAEATCKLRWYLMPVGIVKGSENLKPHPQLLLLGQKYEVPTAIERVAANILYYLNNNKYLDSGIYAARTRDASGWEFGSAFVTPVSVRGTHKGLFIGDGRNALGEPGVAASRTYKWSFVTELN